jgi:hypothetical protein
MYISNGGEWTLVSTLLLFYIIFKKKDSLLLNMFNNQGAQIIGILRYSIIVILQCKRALFFDICSTIGAPNLSTIPHRSVPFPTVFRYNFYHAHGL